MSSKIVITSTESFETITSNMERIHGRIKDIFAKERANIEKINGTEVWTGNCQRAVYRKYKDLEKNYAPIEEAMDLYNKFLRKTVEDYKRFESATEKNADVNADTLDVNS